jgi:glutathione reductase (NADPH)
MATSYDAVVIGSGTAGQTAAYQLSAAGLKVGVVEHSTQPGGTCALSGCQAKKWFYEAAETVARSRHLAGIGIESPASASWTALRDAKNRFTERVPGGTVAELEKAGIGYVRGRARLTEGRAIRVDDRIISARFIVLATGAVPVPLPLDGAGLAITSSDFMQLERLPRRIVFIGGGFISFEFAHFATRLGASDTRCTIIEAASRPLGPFDGEMVGLLSEATRAERIDIVTDVKIASVQEKGGIFTITTNAGRRFEADLVVHGAGRIPDIEDLGLEHAGVRRTKGGVMVNEQMETSNPDIYAVGDCAATIQLARVADAEAQTAAANIIARYSGGSVAASMDYDAVPAVLFTYPQYGMVGATEDRLRHANIAYKKSFAKNLRWPTYRRVGLPSAAYKVLAGEDGLVLGAHILSDNATGLINAFALAMRNGIRAKDLYRQSIMTPYPSRESDIIYMLKPLV